VDEVSQRRIETVISALIACAGVVMLALPLIPVRSVPGVAAIILAAAVLHLGLAWPYRQPGPVVWQILIAVAYAAIGLYLLGHVNEPIETLRVAIAVHLLAHGVFECLFFAGTQGKRFLASGVVALLLSIVVFVAGRAVPAEGLAMLASGVARVFVSGVRRH
jgi:hypothetical protein